MAWNSGIVTYLDADIGHRLGRRMGRVGVLHHLQGDFGEGRGFQVGVAVGGQAGARRHIGDAVLVGDQLYVVFRRGPGDERLGGLFVLGGGGYRQ